MKITITILFLFLKLSFYASNQSQKINEKRINDTTICFTEMLKIMEIECIQISFNNVSIEFNPEIDKAINGMDYNYEKGKGYEFKADFISFTGCKFDHDFWFILTNTNFKGHLSFLGCENLKLLFKNTTINGLTRFNNCSIELINFENNIFNNGIRLVRCELLGNVDFNKCTFNLLLDKFGGGLDMPSRLFHVEHNINGSLKLTSCHFNEPKNLASSRFNSENVYHHVVTFENSNFNNLFIDECQLPNLNFNNVVVANQLYLFRSNFKNIFISGLALNEAASLIEWQKISKRIGALEYNDSNFMPIEGEKITNMTDSRQLGSLMAAYSLIHKVYKTKNDLNHSDSCFVEWKDTERNYLLNMAKNQVDADSRRLYMTRYYLSSLLYIVCDYGTSPSKAIIQSILVILFFAILYFFIPNSRKNQNNNILYFQIKFYLLFLFKKRKDLGNVSKIFKSDDNEQNPVNSDGRLSKLIYYDNYITSLSTTFRKRLRQQMLKDMIKHHKIKSSSLSFLHVKALLVFFFLILQRFMRSLALSLNVFSTLGFGELRIKGWAIYIAVIEGFFGWFLLGMFSVSILNQYLN